MPLTRIRTDDLLSGSVANGTLNATAITGQAAATSADDADLVLIYDNGASALKKMTRANFTAGLSTTLSGAYDAGTFITASKGPVDIQATNNANAATTVLKLAVSGSVSGAGAAGPQILFTIPVSDESKVGAAVRANKQQVSENSSITELNFLTSEDNETLIRVLKLDNQGVAVHGAGASEVYPSSGYAFMVASSGETNAMVVKNSNGYVGIGETSPDYNLHISSTGDAAIFIEADTDNSGEADNPFIKLSQDNTAVQSIIGLCGATDKDPENVTYTGVVNNNMLVGTTTNYGLQLGTNDNVRMTIQNDGYVGIGATAPSYPLSVASSNSAGYVSQIYNSYNGSAGGLWVKAGDTSTSGSPLPFVVQSYDSTNQFYVRQDGAYYHRGSAISTVDSKRDVVEMSESATDLLKDIRVVSYNYKEDPDDRVRRIGFIADDTTNQPGIDSRLTNGGTGFDIQTLVGTLIKAVQELNQRIDDLESGS